MFFLGNDINDLDVMTSVGFCACPSDAADEIKKIANLILGSKGGQGTIRELLQYLEYRR